jgi:peptidoglycan hydrolase-like protein with peptidoglycan-binding domain
VAGLAILLAACGSSGSADPVAAAQKKVAKAQDDLDSAQSTFDSAAKQFCGDAKDYITAVDRYGGALSDKETTVGDIKTAGSDLTKPKKEVTESAQAVSDAKDGVDAAQKNLVDAQAELAKAQTGTTPAPTSSTTTTTLIPPASVDEVQKAQQNLNDAFAGVTDQTTITDATVKVNSAAFALQVAWLKLFAQAGCLTDDQHKQAVEAVTNYTVALQQSLTSVGLYKGAIDGIYGPETVAAVEKLQTQSDLPVTGLVDAATADALATAADAVGGAAVDAAAAQTAAVQTTLKLAGYWDDPIDGKWSDDLTAALKDFQTALGVEPTGVVDPPTLAALEQAIAGLKNPPTTTTTEASTTTTEASTTSTSV